MAMWTWDQLVQSLGQGAAGQGAVAKTGRGYAPLQEVRAYWEALRPLNGLPGRPSIDPRGMDSALEHVFLLERIAPGICRFRLAGMHLTQLMGMEVRGMPLTSLFEPTSRPACESLLEAAFRQPAILELVLESARGTGRAELEARMLLLPVQGESGETERLLGCLVAQGQIGRSPRRFAITRQRMETIPLGDMRKPSVSAARQSPLNSFAEGEAGFAAPGATPGQRLGRPHLRLVKS